LRVVDGLGGRPADRETQQCGDDRECLHGQSSKRE
jgi:hypothetical protein